LIGKANACQGVFPQRRNFSDGAALFSAVGGGIFPSRHDNASRIDAFAGKHRKNREHFQWFHVKPDFRMS
jgi:hypothetical protein